jgi:gamma-glutamylcysteine synthetase
MEATVARKRTVTGVFNAKEIERSLAQIAETPHTPVTAVATARPRRTGEVRSYAIPPLPETFDVRAARALRVELVSVHVRLDASEKRAANSDAKIAILIAEIISLRNGVLKAAAIHSQQATEVARVGKEIVDNIGPLADRARALQEARRRQDEKVARWYRAVWDGRELILGAFLATGTLICVFKLVVYYLRH